MIHVDYCNSTMLPTTTQPQAGKRLAFAGRIWQGQIYIASEHEVAQARFDKIDWRPGIDMPAPLLSDAECLAELEELTEDMLDHDFWRRGGW